MDKCPTNGEAFLIEAFLVPNFSNFDYSYQFNELGEIVHRVPRHYTDRNRNEAMRYCRIAIEAVYDYNEKDNRHLSPDLSASEVAYLHKICDSLNSGLNANIVKRKIEELMVMIQNRTIAYL